MIFISPFRNNKEDEKGSTSPCTHMFSFQACELRWPFLRGVKTLSSLFEKTNTGCVSDVIVVPGHVVVLLHSSTVLCVFDAVPSELQLSESEQRTLSAYLVKQQTAKNTKGEDSNNNDLFKALLLSNHPSPITSLWFEKSRRQHHLHLYACQQDGYLSCWVWIPQKWAWQQVVGMGTLGGKGRNALLLPPTRDTTSSGGKTEPIERIVTNVISTKVKGQKRKQLLLWCETYRSMLNKISGGGGGGGVMEEEGGAPPGDDSESDSLALDNKTRLCWCEITAIYADESSALTSVSQEKKPAPSTTTMQQSMPPPPIGLTLGRSTFADTIDENVERAYASKEGVWFITQNTLYYWPFLTRTLIPKSLQPKDAEGTILAAALHCITQELILLDSTGQMHLCVLEETNTRSLTSSLSSGAMSPLKGSKKDWMTLAAEGSASPSNNKSSLSRSMSHSAGLLRRRLCITFKPFSKCQGLLKTKKEVIAGSILDFCVHQHVAAIVTTESCKFFDLRTGIFLEEQLLPKSLTGEGGIKGSARQAGTLSSEVRFAPKGNRYGGLWRLGAQGMVGSTVGLWGSGGMWLLQMPKVTRQAEAIAQAPLSKRGAPLPPASGSNATDAALLCKDWALTRWHARYLFEEAISARNRQKGAKKNKDPKAGRNRQTQQSVEEVEEGKIIRRVCQDLLPYLENPTLVIGLLAPTPEYRPFVIQELSNYLEKTEVNYATESELNTASTKQLASRGATGQKGRGGVVGAVGYPLKYEQILSSEAEREQRKQAFHYYTPLNRKLQPLLARYLELSVQMNSKNFLPESPRGDAQSLASPLLPSPALPTSSPSYSSSTSFASLLASTRPTNLKRIQTLEALDSLSRPEMETLEADQPALLLQKLQEFLLPPTFEEEALKYNRLLRKEAMKGQGRATSSEVLQGRWLSNFAQHPPNRLLYHPEETLESCFAFLKDQEKERKLQRKRINTGHNSTTINSTSLISGSFKPSFFSFQEEEDEDDPTDLAGDPRPKIHPFFELMCRLYFRERPDLLCPFVKLVHHFASQSAMHQTSYFSRAYATLPPIIFPSPAPATTTTSSKPGRINNTTTNDNPVTLPYLSSLSKEDLRLKARAELLCWDGNSEEALRSLLCMGKWQSAVDIVEKRIGKFTGRTRAAEVSSLAERGEEDTSVTKGSRQDKGKEKEREKDKEKEREREKEKGVEENKESNGEGNKGAAARRKSKEQKGGGFHISSVQGSNGIAVWQADEMDIDVGVDEGGAESLNHFALFHVLLTHCLDLKDPRKLEQCWPLMPLNFGVFDLMRLTRLGDRGKKKPSSSSVTSSSTSSSSVPSSGLRSASTSNLPPATLSSSFVVSTRHLPSYSSIFVKAGQDDEDDEDDEGEADVLEEPLDVDEEEDEDEDDETEEEENEFSVAHFRPQLLAMFRRMKLADTTT